MSDKRVVLALYRAALREARRIDCLCEPTRGLSVRAPMAIAQFGPDHCWSRPEAEYRLDTLRALLPGLLQVRGAAQRPCLAPVHQTA
jgi:hypothetical protein